MAAAVQCLQLTDIELGIDCGGYQFYVVQDLPDVSTSFQHVRRALVPNHVAVSGGHDSSV